jgi:hypothetical protein
MTITIIKSDNKPFNKDLLFAAVEDVVLQHDSNALIITGDSLVVESNKESLLVLKLNSKGFLVDNNFEAILVNL